MRADGGSWPPTAQVRGGRPVDVLVVLVKEPVMSVHHAQRMVTHQDRSWLDDGRSGYRFATTPARHAIAKITSQETGSQAETIRTVRGPVNRNPSSDGVGWFKSKFMKKL